MREERRRRTILVVDDELAIRELLKLQLAAEGYEVVLAEDALGAGRPVREAKPDLMIVDSSMPWVPVIFITGRSERRSGAEALGSACLLKPFLATRLIELVERVLRSQERLYAAAGIGGSPHDTKALSAA